MTEIVLFSLELDGYLYELVTAKVDSNQSMKFVTSFQLPCHVRVTKVERVEQ